MSLLKAWQEMLRLTHARVAGCVHLSTAGGSVSTLPPRSSGLTVVRVVKSTAEGRENSVKSVKQRQ